MCVILSHLGTAQTAPTMSINEDDVSAGVGRARYLFCE